MQVLNTCCHLWFLFYWVIHWHCSFGRQPGFYSTGLQCVYLEKMEAITGTDRIGTVTDLSGAWKFSADFGHPPSVGRNVYFDEPASCMAGWALFLDRGKCSGLEKRFGLDPGWGIHVAGSMIEAGTKYVKEKSVPSLMVGSYYTAGVIGRIGFISLFSFCSAILSLQEMEELKERRDRSVFSREFRLIGDRLVSTGKVWFKSQGIIFYLPHFVYNRHVLVGNPCPVLVGMGIGIMDAFPVLGTGTVLVPWAVIEIAMGSWKTALILTGLYLICTFMRQFLEVHLMSGQMGLSPFETLGAVYVGLKLFGIAGLFLGPLGLLLIEDMTELLITQPMNDEQRHNETNKSAMIDGGNRFMSH